MRCGVFSSIPTKESLQLSFRKAAAANNTKEIIRLSKLGIDLNACGPDSKQTAVHQAAKAGHLEALQLLFNLGVNFDLQDKNNQTAQELATQPNIKLLFDLIETGRQALAARKIFFPKTINECTKQELETRNKCRTNTENEMEKISSNNEIHESYKKEAKQLSPTIEEIERFWTQYNLCIQQNIHITSKKIILKNSIAFNDHACSCGEAAAASFVFLSQYLEAGFPVCEMNIIDKNNPLAGHACVIMNYNADIDPSKNQGWKNALIIDPFKEYIFFYNFIEQYPKDTCVKICDAFNLIPGATNILYKFPTNLAFPKTKELYDKEISKVKNETKALFLQRFKVTENNNPKPSI